LKRAWEKRFPDLFGAWTHWRIEGDGFLLGVVPGESLQNALLLLDDNHERYSRIKVRRATVNDAGECVTVENADFVVSHLHNDRYLRSPRREEDRGR
jgi:hypothetical protein